MSSTTRDAVDRSRDDAAEESSGSKRLAGLVGPTMVAIGASETLTYQIWSDNIAPLIALNGVLLFVAGLAIVRAHNRWTWGWPVLVTLVGWLGMLAGLFRMFLPQVQEASETRRQPLAVRFSLESSGSY